MTSLMRGRGSASWVVDDNRDAADSMVNTASKDGSQSGNAYDGLEAIQAAATFRPMWCYDIGSQDERIRCSSPHPEGALEKGMALLPYRLGSVEDKRRRRGRVRSSSDEGQWVHSLEKLLAL